MPNAEIHLYRATYSRSGSARGMTFAVPAGLFSWEAAERFAETVVMRLARGLDEKSQLLTVKRTLR